MEEPTNIHKVIVELNPAALALEKRLIKEESIESAETEISDLTSSDNYDISSDIDWVIIKVSQTLSVCLL